MNSGSWFYCHSRKDSTHFSLFLSIALGYRQSALPCSVWMKWKLILSGSVRACVRFPQPTINTVWEEIAKLPHLCHNLENSIFLQPLLQILTFSFTWWLLVLKKKGAEKDGRDLCGTENRPKTFKFLSHDFTRAKQPNFLPTCTVAPNTDGCENPRTWAFNSLSQEEETAKRESKKRKPETGDQFSGHHFFLKRRNLSAGSVI